MTEELPRLNVGISVDSALFIAEMRKVNDSINKLGQNVIDSNKKMAQGVSTFTGAVGAARSALSVFGVGLSVGAVTGFVKSTLSAADALKAAADTANVSAEQLQQWRFAASQSGSSAAEMDNALLQLNKRLGDFVIDGTGPAAKAFEELGLAARISSGELSGTGAVMDAAVAALVGIEDASRRASLQADLFGRDAGPKLAGLLSEGVAGINELRKAAVILSNEQVERADEIGDAWERVSQQIITRMQSVTLTLADAFGRGAENQQALADSYSDMADEVIASVKRMADGVDTFMGDRLDGAFAGVQQRTQGVTDAFAAMYNAVVGESYVPDMVREIQGWMEKLEGPAMADPVTRSTDATIEEFKRLATFRDKILEKKEKGMLPPVSAEDQRALQQSLSNPFEHALENVQDEFTNTFAEISRGTIGSFEEMAQSIHGIFVDLASNIATLAIFKPQELQDLLTASRELGGAGLSQGAAQSVTAGALATPLLGMGVGLFGSQGARQGLQIGGGVGAAGGALAGMFLPGGPLVGSILGGLGGSALGSIFGGLFGGGGAGGSEVSFGGAPLGVAGRGGTGEAAKIISQIDKGLMDLLTSRQESLVNDMLRTAPSVSIKYGDEGPSANDIASLTRARIGPAAAALGLSTRGVAGEPGQLTADEMTANLQQAVGILQQVENIRLGPLDAALTNLRSTFLETTAAAKKFSIEHSQVLEEQYQYERGLIQRQAHSEKIALEATIGSRSPINAALAQLKVNMEGTKAEADRLGISTKELTGTYEAQRAAIIAQDASQKIAIAATVGARSPLNAALAQLKINMELARAEAERLGISTANLSKTYQAQEDALRAQDAARIAQEAAQRRQLASERIVLAVATGARSPLSGQLLQLKLDMETTAAQAKALGISTANLSGVYRDQRAALMAQEAERKRQLGNERIGLEETFGQRSPLSAQLARLRLQFDEAGARAAQLGISTVGLATAFADAQREIRVQEAARQRQLALEKITLGVTVGARSPLSAALAQLKLDMEVAAAEAKRLDISTANLTKTYQKQRDEIIHQDLLQRRALAKQKDAMARSITEPFQQLRDPLLAFSKELQFGTLNPAGQMEAAQKEFRRIATLAQAGSTSAIQQLEGAGRAFIEQAGRFGASPALVQANLEVRNAIEAVNAELIAAQKAASRGVEDAIYKADRNNVNTLREMILELRLVADEVKRLGRK